MAQSAVNNPPYFGPDLGRKVAVLASKLTHDGEFFLS